MTQYTALSVVAPHGENIALGHKTIEVRSWRPPTSSIKNLLIVENKIYLTQDGQIDFDGRAVAIVDVVSIEPWLPSQVVSACSTGWQPGYYAWHLDNVRPLNTLQKVMAARKLYDIDVDVLY
jgi:hypothetical protein